MRFPTGDCNNFLVALSIVATRRSVREYTLQRPWGSSVTKPQSSKHLRWFDALDALRPQSPASSPADFEPVVRRSRIPSRAGSASPRNNLAWIASVISLSGLALTSQIISLTAEMIKGYDPAQFVVIELRTEAGTAS